MSKVDEIERIIEQLPPEDFEKLSAWMEQRRQGQGPAQTYPEHTVNTLAFRDHNAFLSSYAPEDEGIYDDAPGR